jgi:hypothetical protein
VLPSSTPLFSTHPHYANCWQQYFIFSFLCLCFFGLFASVVDGQAAAKFDLAEKLTPRIPVRPSSCPPSTRKLRVRRTKMISHFSVNSSLLYDHPKIQVPRSKPIFNAQLRSKSEDARPPDVLRSKSRMWMRSNFVLGTNHQIQHTNKTARVVYLPKETLGDDMPAKKAGCGTFPSAQNIQIMPDGGSTLLPFNASAKTAAIVSKIELLHLRQNKKVSLSPRLTNQDGECQLERKSILIFNHESSYPSSQLNFQFISSLSSVLLRQQARDRQKWD